MDLWLQDVIILEELLMDCLGLGIQDMNLHLQIIFLFGGLMKELVQMVMVVCVCNGIDQVERLIIIKLVFM